MCKTCASSWLLWLMPSMLRRASIDNIDNRNFNPFVFSRNFHKRLRKIETRICYIRTIDEEWELGLTWKASRNSRPSCEDFWKRASRKCLTRSRGKTRGTFSCIRTIRPMQHARTISYASRAKEEEQTSEVGSSKKKIVKYFCAYECFKIAAKTGFIPPQSVHLWTLYFIQSENYDSRSLQIFRKREGVCG